MILPIYRPFFFLVQLYAATQTTIAETRIMTMQESSEQSKSIQSLTSRVQTATTAVDWWNNKYVWFVAIGVVVAAIVFFAQFKVIRKAKELADAQSLLGTEKDRQAALDSKNKDLEIAAAKESAAKASERAEEANKRAIELEKGNLILKGEIAKANTAAATAQRDADKARLDLEQFRIPRVALLTSDKKAKITGQLRQFAGCKFDVAVPVGDAEAETFLPVVESILNDAGFVQIPWQPLNPQTIMYTRPGMPSVGGHSSTNLGFEANAQIDPRLSACSSLAKMTTDVW
jgi:hypothetical protein